jgi:hypothetical protein
MVSSISTAAACRLPPLLLLLQAGGKGCASVYGIPAGLRVPVLPVRSVQVSGNRMSGTFGCRLWQLYVVVLGCTGVYAGMMREVVVH